MKSGKQGLVSGLRVAFFTECYRPIVNGVVASIDVLRSGLAQAGHEVVLVAPEVPGYEERDASVVRIPSLPLPTPTAYRLVIPFVPRAVRARIGRNVSIVHTHSPFVTGWMGLRYARRIGVPLVFTYHTRLEEYAHYVPFERTMTAQAALHLTRAYARAADAVIVPTQAMERRLRDLGVATPIAVIPSAIEVERFAAGRRRGDVRARFGAAGDERLVLLVSRLAKEKNVELALRAFAACGPDARLAVVGGGPHRAELEAEARRAGIAARTVFVGEVPPGELPDVYASADAFAFPSTTETQGLVLAEAMAAGLPVVAVDSAATRDVLGGTGQLCAPDPRALGAALDRALASGRDHCAAHLAFERYNVSVQVRRVIETYGRLVARKTA